MPDVVGDDGAAGAAGVARRVEHVVVDDQLAAAGEEVGQRDGGAGEGAQGVGFRDLDHGEGAPGGGDGVAGFGEGFLLREEGEPCGKPFGA